jgi:eukaryotic translation initiation factor 2C
VELEKGSAPMTKKRPPQGFKIVIRKARDIDMEDLFQFLNAKGNMTNNCKMGKLFLFFSFFNKNEPHNGL